MSEKTKEQLEEQIRVEKVLKEHREESNLLYAPMVVKIVVFGMVGIILTTALVALLSKIIK